MLVLLCSVLPRQLWWCTLCAHTCQAPCTLCQAFWMPTRIAAGAAGKTKEAAKDATGEAKVSTHDLGCRCPVLKKCC